MYPQQPAPVSFNSTPKDHSPGKLIVIVVLALLLIAALVFGYWAYNSRQDYKNNTDKKINAAVTAAENAQAAKLQAEFAEQSKSPYKVFSGSATYGSITFNYPKTWSAYVDTTNPSEPINAYFFPNQVPGIQSKTAFALRIELLSTDYSQVLQQYSGLISQGTVKAKAYVPPKLKGVPNVQTGTLFSGQTNTSNNTQSGTLLAIKVRDKTLEISTQSSDYLNDFNKIILASLKFAP
ncbi:MAG TPA: hypothetical protein VHD84_01995 [Candidatus Saccharimonadales bacterium]|nr:hypothetical protein [Candidatus Saccharimonadales bacterium]